MELQDVNALRPGAEVCGVDGEKVGKIAEVHPDHVVVEKGLIFREDHLIPSSAIASVGEDGTVYLNVSRDEAVNLAWANPATTPEGGTSPGLGDESYDPTYDGQGRLTPAGQEAVDRATGAAEPVGEAADETADRMGGGAGPADELGTTDAEDQTGLGEVGKLARMVEPAATAGLTGTTDAAATMAVASMPGYTGETATDEAAWSDRDGGNGGPVSARRETSDLESEATRINVPVHDEELVPVKRDVDLGSVRVEKEVVTEERTITVPITEERLRITRQAADGTGGEDADAFGEDVIEIPIRGEQIEVVKRPMTTGEVVIEKETVQRTERVGDTVRREEVRVEEDRLDGERGTGAGL